MPHRKSTCLYRRILRLVPRIFKTDPWQTMLCVAALGMGLGTALAMFFPQAISVVDQPLQLVLMRALWSVCFLGGSLFQLYALTRAGHGGTERLGISLAGVGWGVYSLALFSAGSPAGYSLATAVGIMAAGHLIVLIGAEVARRLSGHRIDE